MKNALCALAALLLVSGMHIQPVHALLRAQPAPGLSVEIGPSTPVPPQSPSEERLEERLREGFYDWGSEEWVKKECARSAERATTAIG